MKKFIVSLCVILISCENGSNGAAQAELGVPYIKIVGEISTKTVELLKNAPSDVKKVVITSQGGDTKAAIAAARVLNARGFELVVRGYCLSACAQMLMPAAKKVTLEDMPIVGMHQTATAFEKLLYNAGMDDEAVKYAEVAQLEQQFYDDLGVDRAMLEYPYGQTEPICYIPSNKANLGIALIAAKWKFVAITKASYQGFTKRSPSGNWPETKNDIIKYGSKHIPPEVNTSIVPERGNISSIVELGRLNLRECDPEMRLRK